MKFIKHITIFATICAGLVSCKEYPQMVEYPAPDPVSEIGKALVANTGYIASIYKDTSYVLHSGVEVTELSYLSNAGRSMRTFWYKIDLNDPAITLECITPLGKPEVGARQEVLSSMLSHADRKGHKVIGGTSSDFGGGAGPQGVYWAGGKCLKSNFIPLKDRPRCFVYINKDETVGMGYEAEYKEFIDNNKDKVSEIFCGSPRLIAGGKISIDTPNDLDSESHPRTAIGLIPEKKIVYLMVVDGRRYDYSNGMHLDILANVFSAIGCTEALNLDGGGSSTFIVGAEGKYGDPKRFIVKNWPNDNGGQERALNNGLAIVASDM